MRRERLRGWCRGPARIRWGGLEGDTARPGRRLTRRVSRVRAGTGRKGNGTSGCCHRVPRSRKQDCPRGWESKGLRSVTSPDTERPAAEATQRHVALWPLARSKGTSLGFISRPLERAHRPSTSAGTEDG